jgi:hypothetical protein
MADVPLPVQSAIDAANAGDAEAFLDSFVEGEGAVDDWGRVFRGRDAIRGWSDSEFIGKQVTLEVTGVRTDGAVTVVSAQVGGNGFNGPSDFAFEVSADKLARMTISG